MELYFLRHAKAYPRSAKWTPDSKRPLTAEGEKRMQEAACGLGKLKVNCEAILTSPYARALKTAEIAAKELGGTQPVITENLIPEANPQQLVDELLSHYGGKQTIMLVGHEPFMSGLISTLLTGNDSMAIDFKKAGLCKLSIRHLQFGKCACLEWLMNSRQLAALGKR